MPKSQGIIDALIIGGGHNGLVCAYYLAKKGLNVHIYEKRAIIRWRSCHRRVLPWL